MMILATAGSLAITRWARWSLIALAILAGTTLAVPARAGVNVLLDPTGGGGSNANVTINTSQLTWAPGNVLAINALNPGGFSPTAPNGNFNTGPVEIKYQAILGGIAGLTQNNGTVAVVGQQNDTTPANGGAILTNGVSTGRELVITADFRENLTYNAASNSLTFTFAPGAPNTMTIFDAPAGTAKNFSGAGFTAGVPILTGSAISSGLEGPFHGALGIGSTASGTLLNQYGGDQPAQVFWAGQNTISASGSTFIPVHVNSFNPAYFPTGASFMELTFPSISSAMPFGSVEPSQSVLGTSTAGTLGLINSFSGPNVLFQAQASNDFAAAVPEPWSIIPALTAALAIPSFLFLRRRSKTAVA